MERHETIDEYRERTHDITVYIKDGELWLGDVSLTRIATKITLRSDGGIRGGELELTIPAHFSGHVEALFS